MTIDAIDRAGQRPDGTIVDDLPQSARTAAGRLRGRGRRREPADQYRLGRLRVLRSGGHHPGARPHARRSARRRSSPTGPRPKPRSGWPTRATELRKRLKDGTPLETLATELVAGEADQARPEARSRRWRFRPRRRRRRLRRRPKAARACSPSPTGDAQILFKVTEVFEPAGADADSVSGRRRKVVRMPASPTTCSTSWWPSCRPQYEVHDQPERDRPGAGVLSDEHAETPSSPRSPAGTPLSFEEARRRSTSSCPARRRRARSAAS